MSFGGSPVLSRLPLPYPEPCTLPEPILVCLELWKSLPKCFERAFCSPHPASISAPRCPRETLAVTVAPRLLRQAPLVSN